MLVQDIAGYILTSVLIYFDLLGFELVVFEAEDS